MESRNKQEFIRYRLMPHEHLMEELGIDYSDLNEEVLSEVQIFRVMNNKSLEDGFIDDHEEQELIKQSQKIAGLIKQSIKENKLAGADHTSATVLGVLGGIVVGIAGFFGLKSISK
jgi:hypothetical protein